VVSHPFLHYLRERCRPQGSKFIASYYLKAELLSSAQIIGVIERAAHTNLKGARRLEQPFFRSPSKGRPVRVTFAKVFVPCVTVRVELHQCQWPMSLRENAELSKSDRMVSSETDKYNICVR